MQNQKRETISIPGKKPSVQLTEQQTSHLSDELSHFGETYDKSPHPMQAQAVAFNIWDYNDDEDILTTIETNLDIINDLVKEFSSPSIWGYNRQVCNIQSLLKQNKLFLQLLRLPVLEH